MSCRSADSHVRADSPVRISIKIAAWVIVLLCSFFAARAAAPLLDGFYPAGGERASTNAVLAVGKFEAWPPKVWVDGAGLTFTAEANKGKFLVSIATDASVGPRLVRLYDEDGPSEPHFFVVGEGHEITETEPNNHFAKAQRVELPVTINGRLDKNGDVDSFSIKLRAGQWLEVRVDSYTLMSKVDAVLKLVSTNGQQLAWNHDFITLDPRLVWRATNDETVVLQIFGFAFPPGSDIGFTGGEAAVYRLNLALTNVAPRICESATEKEPNDTAAHAERMELPANIRGTIQSATDEDRFSFSAKKGETIEVRIEAASFGSPLDAWLTIEDSSGNSLARNDDADGSNDPRLEWNAPTNGNFIVAIGSVTHRGGDEFCYRLSLQQLLPDYRATLAAGSLMLTTGTTNEVKLDFKRLRGFTNNLLITFRDLPEGVTALTTNLPAKDGSVAIQLSAALNAPKFQGPVKLFVIDPSTGQERAVSFELTTRGETGFNHLLIESSDQLWLTVSSKPAVATKPAKK